MKMLTFDQLPDEAFVGVRVGCDVSNRGRSKLYADSKAGVFPPIVKIGNSRSAGIRVGELRRWLRDPANYCLTDAQCDRP